ncbi:MAG: transcriptional regulator [Bacteroidota bacterium]
MSKAVDPVQFLHQMLRLKIMSLLVSLESASFTFLLEKTEATRGNLSVQITKLKEAGYLSVEKSFHKNYPLTTCKITPKGIDAFEQYVETISAFLHPSTKKNPPA